MAHTECIPERMEFQRLGSRDVSAAPDGGEITSDAGGLLLREVERGVKLIEGPAGCFEDGRAVGRVEDELLGLVKQRVYALVLGYEDVNNHERLRFDPMLEILSRVLQRDPGSVVI